MNSKVLLELDSSDISRADDTIKSGTMSSNLSRTEECKMPERRTRSARKMSIASNGPLQDMNHRWESEIIPDLEIPPEPQLGVP